MAAATGLDSGATAPADPASAAARAVQGAGAVRPPPTRMIEHVKAEGGGAADPAADREVEAAEAAVVLAPTIWLADRVRAAATGPLAAVRVALAG